jgi:hypothetical protein
MNGNEQTVPKGGQFPEASPLFRIVAVGTMRASIVGKAYEIPISPQDS